MNESLPIQHQSCAWRHPRWRLSSVAGIVRSPFCALIARAARTASSQSRSKRRQLRCGNSLAVSRFALRHAPVLLLLPHQQPPSSARGYYSAQQRCSLLSRGSIRLGPSVGHAPARLDIVSLLPSPFTSPMNPTETPNHALQRTAPRVTVAAISCPGASRPSHLLL